MRLSVFNSKELQGTILLVKGASREIAAEIRRRNKAVIGPVWEEAVRGEARTPLQTDVLANTTRVSVSDQNVVLSAASIGRPLAGGGSPPELAAGAEFGSQRFKQFGTRASKGKVFYPAAAKVIPRIASLWVQTTIRTFYELIERK